MSRLNELKKQYPELNISIFDLLTRMDTTKSYKYLPLLCKIFGQRFNTKERIAYDEGYSKWLYEVDESLKSKKISLDGLSANQRYFLNHLTDFYSNDSFQIFSDFMGFLEKGKIKENDISGYSSIEDLRSAVSLATLNELTKELEGQVIKEYEDDTWVILRPLTFASSAKYGAGTRWCTTYQKEKQYFEKYWRNGILVYFINKKTGYKFAGFKDLINSNEFSFWNAEDHRIDYITVEADDYIFPIVKRIFNSNFTNKNLSSYEIQEQVHNECIPQNKIYMDDTIEPILGNEEPQEISVQEAEAISHFVRSNNGGGRLVRLMNATISEDNRPEQAG